jgi:glycosyltransferase involved in cell wall biosynthesis
MKKIIKIFSLPSHQSKERTSGVDYARIIQPMQFLHGYEDDEVKFEVTLYDIHKVDQLNWQDVAKENDIIYLNYIADPWAFARMGALARHYKRKIVLDTDDDLYSIMPDNPAYKVYQKGSEALNNLTCIYNEVDFMTTTTSYLKNVLLSHTNKRPDQIKVLPNYIDLDTLYTHRSLFKDTHEIQLYHFGSTTHFIDLDDRAFMEGVDMIFKEYPNITFKTVGALLPKYKEKWGMRYSNAYGDTDIYKWVKNKFPTLMDEADIMVVPLADNPYTRSKSNIKYLEASSAKKPGVYQRMRQYSTAIAEGHDGLLASTAKDWYTALKRLIDDKELRRKMGERAYENIVENWQAKDHIKERADFFKMVLDN